MVLDMAARRLTLVRVSPAGRSRMPEERRGFRIMATIARAFRDFALLLLRSYMRFSRDDGWAIASHITLSGVMALFPFLIFCAALAAFLDLGELPATAAHLVFDLWPPQAAEAIAREVETVLTVPRGDVLTFGALLALFFASGGIEALRLGLNRAYRVPETRSMLLLRLQSLLAVIAAAIVIAAVALLLVFLPLAWSIARRHAPWLDDYAQSVHLLRLAIAALVVIVALIAGHKFLPAGRRGLLQILPGVAFTLVCWLAGSLAFGAWLGTFADYVSTYAGLAGVIVALIYLYMLSAIFLIGAEINHSLCEGARAEG
jgi:membrane protein